MVQDNWSLKTVASYGISGGQSSAGYVVGDSNFLGFGKTVEYSWAKDSERTYRSILYLDPGLFGGRHRLGLQYGRNSDGSNNIIDFVLPFYALDTSRSYGTTLWETEVIDSRYSGGKLVDKYRHDTYRYDLFWGRSKGLRNEHADRWKIGISYLEQKYSQVDIAMPVVLPADSTLSYPWLEYELIEDKFIKTNRLFLLNRLEDINVGNGARIKLGYLSRELKSDNNGLIFDSSFNTSWRLNTDNLLFLSLGAAGRIEDGTKKEFLISGQLQYFLPHSKNLVFYANILLENAPYYEDRDPLVLGGDTGLRGYPLNYQVGRRKKLLNLEYRYYTNLHIFRAFHAAGVIFADAGRVWDPVSTSNPDQGTLGNVGFGLRLSSTRTGGANVLHLDVAYPVDPDPSIASVQYIIKSHTTF